MSLMSDLIRTRLLVANVEITLLYRSLEGAVLHCWSIFSHERNSCLLNFIHSIIVIICHQIFSSIEQTSDFVKKRVYSAIADIDFVRIGNR